MVTQSVKVFGAASGAPGIQVRETSAASLSSDQGFGTTAVFAALKRGPMGVPIPVDNFDAYQEIFGKPGDSNWHLFPDSSNLAPDAISGIFAESGGSRLWTIRNELDGNAKKAEVIIRSRVSKEPVLKITAANEGRWGGRAASIPSTPLVLATERTFTLVAPGVLVDEFADAKATFSGGTGKEYEVISNTAADEDTGEVVFTISSQFNLVADGVTGPSEISGVANYSQTTPITGSIEAANLTVTTGTVTLNGTVMVGDGTAFNSELAVGGIIYINDIPRIVQSISSDTSATIDTEYPIPIENEVVSVENKTVTGTGTAFDTELAVGDKIIVSVNGNTYERTIAQINSATELELASSFPEEVTAGTAASQYNTWVEGTTSDYANDLAVGDYVIDPNRNGPAKKVVEIDTVATPERFRVESIFEGGDFTNASIVKQTLFASVDLEAEAGSGLSVKLGQGIKFPDTHFSIEVEFDRNLVFQAGDVSLDPNDSLYVVREINEANVGYRIGNQSYQTWVQAEPLFSGSYTTDEQNDVRPANGSEVILAVEESKIYTGEFLDPTLITGSLIFPNPYAIARQSFRVQNFVAPVTVGGTISSTGTTVNGVSTEFTEIFAPGDYLYIPQTGETKKVISITSDTELVIEEAFAIDLPALSEGIKAGYFGFDGRDMRTIANVGDRYLSVFPEPLTGGYDGDQNIIPFWFTRYFDLDRNLLEDVVFGLNQGLIRIAIPGVSDVVVQKAAAAYCYARAYELRAEIPSNIDTEPLAETFVNQQLGRNDAITIAFPSYGFISSPFSRGKRLIPITGDIMGMESRYAIDSQGYHKPAAGITAILSRIIGLNVTLKRSNMAILNNAGIQQIFEMNGNIVVYGNRLPALDDTYSQMHVRRIQSSYVRFFMEARELLQILFKVNQPETVEQVLLFLRSFAEREYKRGVYTRFLTFEDVVKINASPNSSSSNSKKDVVLSVVNGELCLQYSYLPTGVIEKIKLSVGPDEIVSSYTSGA